MHFTKLLSVVFFATLASHVQAASDECCPCALPGQSLCADATGCTPYCGKGPCNVFGCNCSGGCRGPRQARSIVYTGLAAAGTTEDHFNAIDTNNDGKITFGEWAATDENKNADKDVLAAHWAKFDSADVGYLTKADVNSRIA